MCFPSTTVKICVPCAAVISDINLPFHKDNRAKVACELLKTKHAHIDEYNLYEIS